MSINPFLNLKTLRSLTLACLFSTSFANAADWDHLPVPAKPEKGKTWKLLEISDDFTYKAESLRKPEEFEKRWNSSYINTWTGPGKTEWSAGHNYVTNGHLGIAASRKPGTDYVHTGIITSKKFYRYPLYIETRAKIAKQVLASCVWMLSEDSTEEIDILEAYGSDRPSEDWYAKRLHLSHHTFIRKPFQDYQPKDEGSWYARDGITWSDNFHRIGVYWRDPWHLEYYVDGKLARVTSGKEMIDPEGYTKGTGLSKEMKIIINMENQGWRVDTNTIPSDAELANIDKTIMWVDWIRVYQAVDNQTTTQTK